MNQRTLLTILGTALLGAAALYAVNKKEHSQPVPAAGIEQAIGGDEPYEPSAARQQTSVSGHSRITSPHLISSDEKRGKATELDKVPAQDNETVLPDLYQTFKPTLEAVVGQEVRSFNENYGQSDRLKGDYYVTDNGSKLTLKQVVYPAQPANNDFDVFIVELTEDGSYTLSSENMIGDEEGISHSYILFNGSEQDVKEKIPAFLGWYNRFERIMSDASDIDAKDISVEEKKRITAQLYDTGFTELKELAASNGIYLDPLTQKVMRDTVGIMQEMASQPAE